MPASTIMRTKRTRPFLLFFFLGFTIASFWSSPLITASSASIFSMFSSVTYSTIVSSIISSDSFASEGISTTASSSDSVSVVSSTVASIAS